MKNILTTILMAAAMIACSKTNNGDKLVAGKTAENQAEALHKSISGENGTSDSYVYHGLDGSRAKVSFNNAAKNKTATIEANGKVFELDKTGDGVYERAGIKAVAKGDSVIISQGGNTIPLVLDKQ